MEEIARAKFLGVIIEYHLAFNDLFEFVTNKISKSREVMYKLSSLFPSYVILKLYFSLVYPHLVYGVTAWGSAGLTNIRRLQAVQNRAVGLMPRVPGRDKYVSNKLFQFRDIFRYYSLIKLFRTVILDEHSHLI